MYDLARFSLSDMTRCGTDLRDLKSGAASMEEVAQRIVSYLYEHLIGPGSRHACALVRFYKTHPFGDLDGSLQRFALSRVSGQSVPPDMRCLTLLASTGSEPGWCSRDNSIDHKAIPLPSEEMVSNFPMISQLIRQFGLEVAALVRPDPQLMLELDQKQYNIFYVPEARGSSYIPAQDDFVIPHNIQSVLGFGGMLPSGNLFAIILFSRVVIPRETAKLFRTLALSAKLSVLPFDGGAVFA